MGTTRRLDNGEAADDIIFTVSPYAAEGDERDTTSGSVGVNASNPERGTLQVDNPSVKRIDQLLDFRVADRLQNYDGATDNTDGYGVGQFYREGSRVYLDGLLSKKGSASIPYRDQPLFTLPTGYRPIKSEIFIVTCNIVENATYSGLSSASFAWVYVSSDGKVTIQALGGWRNPDNGPSSGATYGTLVQGNLGTDSTVNLSGWISLGGINFRVSGSY